VTHHRTVIVGTGFSGIGMAIKLVREGERDFVLLERADEIGGTWRDNTYPGCRCDVPSHLYSFSFAPNPNWSSTFSPQPEILEYLRGVAARFGVMSHVRFGTEMESAEWDEAESRWRLETTQGPITAEVLIAAQGPLSDPLVPDLPGLDSFEGTTFHSARWDHDHRLDGERVAVVGTGASAIQFVPKIQPLVGQMHVFQRTPPWVMPHPNRAMNDWERRLYGRLPAAQLAMRAGIYWARETFVLQFRNERMRKLATRMALRQLEQQVPDPELRAKLTPRYELGCKRILPTDEWYPALMQPNVDVVTGGIREIRPHSIVSTDGTEREVDTIIFGTGFQVTDQPFARHIFRGDGRSLADVWAGSPRAHLGTTVAGFPNLFILQGPGTGLGHSSVLLMIEAQIAHLVGAMRYMGRHGLAAIEPRATAQDAFVAGVDRRMEGTVWTAGGCRSWYLDSTGRNSTIWPGSIGSFRRRASRFAPGEYVMSR
jgi:cation diffusion facilitator CzcD-associated flavoprotein CzcO